MNKAASLALAGVFVFAAGAADAQSNRRPQVERGVNNERGSTKSVEIPRCTRNLGTITIVDGEGRGWTQYNVGAPSTLLKTFISRSNCFRLVDRGAGMEVAQRERAMAAGGDLQRGANVGRGQVRAADYVLVADVASGDQNAGGNAIGGLVGGIVGGRAGALIGGIRTQRVEAQTVLSITNVRTSEVEATIEGFASKRDISFGVGGGTGWGWGAGGGYEDTELGKVIGLSFLDAYRQLVGQMGGLAENASAAAPRRAFQVRAASAEMRRSPAASSTLIRSLQRGQMVYPLEGREGMWWEVEDENGNTGWMLNDRLEPKP
jgi:hypothetical protein